MSKRIVNKKITIVLASAICAAGFGLIGCGDDSKGSGPNAQGDVCTVDKNGNTLSVKMEANGVVTTTIYEFGDDGNMVSQSTVTDVGDNGKAACEAMNVEGVSEASFEGGKCTVKTTAGLMPGSIDQLEQAQQKACDAANEAVKPASTDSGNKNPFAKSSNSSGNGGTGADDICSVTKTGTTVTIKENVEGESYTTVFVFAGGELTSVVSTADLSAIGDDVTAEAVCNAYAKGGATAKYDKGKCTVTEDVEIFGAATLDEVYEDNVETCNEAKAAANPANGGDEGTTPGSSDSGSTTKTSSNSGNKEKVVTFADGIIWQPSYESRAQTFFGDVNEYNFFEESAVTGDSSGWWFKYLDDADFGASTAVGVFGSSSLDLSITLKYIGWHKASDGLYYYNAPDPYPYAGFGFKWSKDGSTVDLSGWTGICVTYQSTKPFEIALPATGDGGMAYYYPASSATSPKTVDIAFPTSLTRSQYAKTSLTKAEALKNVEALHFKYTNDEANVECDYEYYAPSECALYVSSPTNTIKIYKIGKYGTCNSGSGTVL